MGDVAALTWPLRRPGGLLAALPRGPRRCLFGALNQEDRTLFLKERMSQLMQENTQRWNFDFANDKPIAGRYKWQPVGNAKNAALEKTDLAETEKCAKNRDDDSKIKECTSPETEEIGTSDNQTLITDFMRKRKSSNLKDGATVKSKAARRSST